MRRSLGGGHPQRRIQYSTYVSIRYNRATHFRMLHSTLLRRTDDDTSVAHRTSAACRSLSAPSHNYSVLACDVPVLSRARRRM